MSRLALMIALMCTAQAAISSTVDGKATKKWSEIGIEDVEVTVAIPGGAPLQTTKTDADGKFSVKGLPAGRRVEIKYLRDDYQEKPTFHYLTLVDGSNFDNVSMSPEEGNVNQFREYGAMLYHRDQKVFIDTETYAMYAHLPAEKRAAVAEGWVTSAEVGISEEVKTIAIEAFLLKLESAAAAERSRQNEEHLNALAAEVGALAYTRRDLKGGLVISVPAVYKSEQTVLPSSTQKQYNLLAATLKSFDEYDILVVGHTDNTGSPIFNMSIADKRANTVKEYLLGAGIQPGKIRTVSYGEVPAKVSNTTRRVDLIIVPHSKTP
jgi:outer membrane protein OmpA-like peptidoglycan-associated protein